MASGHKQSRLLYSLPKVRRARRFIRRYSTQLTFGSFVLVFLTFSVGESQAYDPNFFSSNIADEQALTQSAGFVGKPELFIGQTILTGEVQQLVAVSYTVEKGDSLLGIAQRYNTTVAELIETNNIKVGDIEKIRPGTELLIPAGDKTSDSNSLAWLNELNQLKAQEREAARQAELERQRRLSRSRTTTVPNSRTTTRVTSLGGYSVLGTYRNLPANGAFPGQCTNWVKYKRPDLPAKMGNGGQYLAYARSYGIATGSTPRGGAIVVTTESPYGHVAMVESVNGDSITVTEMNYVGPYVVSRRTIPVNSSVIRGYVY